MLQKTTGFPGDRKTQGSLPGQSWKSKTWVPQLMMEVTKCLGLSLGARLKFSLELEILGSENNNMEFRNPDLSAQ